MNKKPRKPYPQRAKLPLDVLLWRGVTRGRKDECWLWDATRATTQGYGVIRFNRATMLAHRAAWIVTNGPIPAGMGVLHKCDNPPCCNPSHLFLGTQRDNCADCMAKGRFQRGERQGQAVLTERNIINARKRWLAGESISEIAQAMRVRSHTLWEAVTGRKWKHVTGLLAEIITNPRFDLAVGERNWMARLKERDIVAIRSLNQKGIPLGHIGKRYGVTRQNIWNIVKRKTWKHVS